MPVADTPDELAAWHLVLQLAGLAPHVFPAGPLSLRWVVYGVTLSVFNLAVISYAETDAANNGMYANKTTVVDTAFEIVDWLSNLYVTIGMLLSIIYWKRSGRMFVGAAKLCHTFTSLGVTCDIAGKRRYFMIHLGVLTLFSVLVLAVGITLEEISGNHYTILYWITILIPLIEASIVVTVFSSCVFSVQRALKVVNGQLSAVTAKYIERQNLTQSVVNIPRSNYEKSLEGIILANQLENSKTMLFSKRKFPPITNLETPGKLPSCFIRKLGDPLDEVRAARNGHYEALAFGGVVNSVFGPHFALLLVWYFFGVIINVYAAVSFHVKGEFLEEYAEAVLWSATYMAFTIYIIRLANTAVDESKETITKVHKFWTNVSHDDITLKRELEGFAMQLSNSPLEFTACGFFTLNSGLLFSFVAGVISNVIFIVQFDKLNLQDIK